MASTSASEYIHAHRLALEDELSEVVNLVIDEQAADPLTAIGRRLLGGSAAAAPPTPNAEAAALAAENVRLRAELAALRKRSNDLLSRPAEAAAAAHPTHATGYNLSSIFQASREDPYPPVKERDGSLAKVQAGPRVAVEDALVPWSVPWEGPPYTPEDYTSTKVRKVSGKGADPEDFREITRAQWEERMFYRGERRRMILPSFDADGRPLNPIGRTGLRGRGNLFRWGPNYAADIVVTRWKPDAQGLLEMLVKPHRTLRKAIVGGVLHDDDFQQQRLSALTLHKVLKELLDTLVDRSVPDDWLKETARAQLREIDWLAECKLLSVDGSEYVDDPRATDNAWMESAYFHLHLDDAKLSFRARLGMRHWQLRARRRLGKPEVGFWAFRSPKRFLALPTTDLPTDQFQWVSLDDEHNLYNELGSLDHAKKALVVKEAMLPRISVKPLATSQLVALGPIRARDGGFSEVTKQLFESKEITHVTGLVDEHVFRRLLASLWIDAGRPRQGVELPELPTDKRSRASAEAVSATENEWKDLMHDRCNWSRHNLRTFASEYRRLGYKHEVQALVDLQRHTTADYAPVLSMPVHLLSMRRCNNMKPFERTLIATDQLECLSHGSRSTYFHLNGKVFDTGSMYLSRAKLKRIAEVLKASPMCSITFDDATRKLAGIPESARFFCCSFGVKADATGRPVKMSELLAACGDEEEQQVAAWSDPFFNFLTVGAFLYFDMAYQIIAMSALCYEELAPKVVAEHAKSTGANLKFFCGRPQTLPPSAIQPIIQCGRWMPVSVPIIQQYGFHYYAWIKPSEFLGDHTFPKNGGFAYLHKSWQESVGGGEASNHHLANRSKFFPIITPNQDYGGDDEDEARLRDLAADGDSAHIASEFDAPLYIPELTNKNLLRMDRMSKKEFSAKAAWQSTADKFTVHEPNQLVDVSRGGNEISDIKMADARKSARGVEQQLGFESIAELLAYQESLLDELCSGDSKGGDSRGGDGRGGDGRGGDGRGGDSKGGDRGGAGDVGAGGDKSGGSDIGEGGDTAEGEAPRPLSRRFAKLIEAIDALPEHRHGGERERTCAQQVQLADDKFREAYAAAVRARTPPRPQQRDEQKALRDTVRSLRDQHEAAAAAWVAVRAADTEAHNRLESPETSPSRSRRRASLLHHRATVSNMKQQEPRAEAAWTAWLADEHRPCLLIFVEVLAAVEAAWCEARGGHAHPERGGVVTDAQAKVEALVDAAVQIDNAYYVLCACAEEKKVWGNDENTETVRDIGRFGETLEDFATKREAEECNLAMSEVAALRLYTTSSFRLINQPLRTSAHKNAVELRAKRHPLAITTYHITNGLKKLRALNFRSFTHTRHQLPPRRRSSLSVDDQEYDDHHCPSSPSSRHVDSMHHNAPETSYLWRGLKNLKISNDFLVHGGAELACMSTSESLHVIANYAQSNAPLLFRIKIESPMDKGASIQWLSVYPQENEVLYPPLMYLKPLLKQKIRGHGGEVVTIKMVYPS